MTTEALSIQDRIALLSILPAQSDMTTLKIVRELREELSFSEEDHEKFGIIMEEGRILWSTSANGEAKSIEIGRKAREVIVVALEGKNRQKQLEDGHLGIWDRFMEDVSD